MKSNKCSKGHKSNQNRVSLNLYNQSRLIHDNCEFKTYNRQSKIIGNYMVNNLTSLGCENNISKIVFEQPNIYYRDGYGNSSLNGCNIDKDSCMRNGSMITNQGNNPQQLFERPFLTVPYMGRGVGNSCTESELLTGDQTGTKRQCNTLSEITIDNYFTPLVSCLQSNVQNPQNLIPEVAKTGWVRGGVPSRQIVKNINYSRNFH